MMINFVLFGFFLSKLLVYDFDNKEYDLLLDNQFNNHYVVFYNGSNCIACIEILTKLLNDKEMKYVVVSEIENSNLRKKLTKLDVEKKFRTDNIFFNFKNFDNLFGILKIKHTPTVLFVKNNSYNLIDYDELFEDYNTVGEKLINLSK